MNIADGSRNYISRHWLRRLNNARPMKLSNLRRSFSENGWYVTFAESYEWIAKRVRGRLLYRKLGAKNLQLGPRAIIRGLCCIRIGQNFSAGQGLWLEAITQY